jgi:hypothetical protein
MALPTTELKKRVLKYEGTHTVKETGGCLEREYVRYSNGRRSRGKPEIWSLCRCTENTGN